MRHAYTLGKLRVFVVVQGLFWAFRVAAPATTCVEAQRSDDAEQFRGDAADADPVPTAKLLVEGRVARIHSKDAQAIEFLPGRNKVDFTVAEDGR